MIVRVLVLIAIAALAAPAVAAPRDARERAAREAFALGRYDQALELFGKLYADTLHPTYLRNIGRCHQNLGDPDRALTSFRDYLRVARDITPSERGEVEGFINEMEALRRRRAAEAAVRAAASAVPVALPPPTVPVKGAATAVPMGVRAPAAEPAPPAPHRSRWWLWTLGGAVLAGGAAALFASGVFTRTDRAVCPADRECLR